ncbi:hypothetical protein [uncultured Psychrobacter sp.]|uniref:hypothetical protein n=1 Tax=uncultured Psychrobacter sp. TaxID=259303 RepID=UPI003459416F
MIDNNESTLGGRHSKSTEYKGRKIKFSDLSTSDLQAPDLQTSGLHGKKALKVEKSADLHGKKALEVEKRADLHDKNALEVEKRADKSQKYSRKLKVEIDDKEFEVVELEEGVFESGLLPYSSYSSPIELAQDVIDYVSEFKK